MKKLFILSALVLSIIVVSCSKDETQNLTPKEQKEYVDNKLGKKYGFTSVEENANLSTISSLKSASISAKKGLCLNFKDASIKVYAVQISENPRKFALYKVEGASNSKSYTSYVGEMINTLDSLGNGFVEMKYNNGTTSKVVLKKKPILSQNKSNQTLFKLAMAGWCQQEGKESYNDCLNRETDEFCSDWVSTVAYYTNPTIAILIATMCACHE